MAGAEPTPHKTKPVLGRRAESCGRLPFDHVGSLCILKPQIEGKRGVLEEDLARGSQEPVMSFRVVRKVTWEVVMRPSALAEKVVKGCPLRRVATKAMKSTYMAVQSLIWKPRMDRMSHVTPYSR